MGLDGEDADAYREQEKPNRHTSDGELFLGFLFGAGVAFVVIATFLAVMNSRFMESGLWPG